MPFNKKNLTIQTNTENTSSTAVDTDVMHDKYHSTPRTEASTPDMNVNANNNNTRGNNMPATPVNVRGRSDLRSPGISKTPSNAAGNAHKNALRDDDKNDNAPMPSFITQTDRYGNSTTPRPGTGNSNNSSSNHNNIVIQETNTDETDKESSGGSGGHRHESVDACDTLLESLRMMCCCILPDSSSHSQVRSDKDAKENDLTSVYQYPSSDRDTNMNRNMNMNANGINHSQNYNYNHNRNSSLSGNLHSQAQATGTGVDHNNTQTINTSIMSPQQIVKEDVDGSHDIKLLPDLVKGDGYHGKKCLVLDLDETLVHSSFRAVPGADFVIPVQIEDIVHFVYVMKRPGVDEFLIEMAKHYEIVVYTASLNKYADPLLDLLDPNQTIRYRLFRESCVYYEGSYVKDLSLLNRDLSQSIIVDNSAASYIFHPENAIDCSSFIDDPMDRELIQIGSFLKGIKNVDNVRGLSNMWREWPRIPNVRGVDFPTNMSTSIGIVGSYDEYDEDERQMSEPVQV